MTVFLGVLIHSHYISDNSDKFSLTLVAGKKKAIYLASSQGPCLITQASLDIKTS